MSKRIDLAGREFGDLTVIKLSAQTLRDGTRLWECKCECGNTTHVASFSLLHGHYKSCGCMRDKKRDEGVKRHISSDAVNGTRISALQSKIHKGNTSGYKGVTWMSSRNKWRAYIGYKGKQISLGYFDKKQDAIAARLNAEEEYHKPHMEERK